MFYRLSQDCERDDKELPTYSYKRRMADEVEIVSIAECHTCGSLMTETEEVITYNGETFCSEICRDDYLQIMEE